MNKSAEPFRLSRPLLSSLVQWKILAAIAAAFTIAVSLYRCMDTLHSGAIVAYLLYTLSIGFLALLIYTRAYIRYPEVRLLGAFLIWTFIVILLNVNRVEGVLSSDWFHSLCVTCFICFSLPYAFEAAEQKTLVSVLALITVLFSAALSAFALFYVARGRIIDAHPGVEGILGIGQDGRLWLFCHPNAAAPICGSGVILSAYIFFTTPRNRLRFALVLPFLVCIAALALTDSRAGILATTLALGTEAFLVLCARSFALVKPLFRILLAVALSIVIMGLFYQGNAWIRRGYNSYISSRQTVSVASDDATADGTPAKDNTATAQPQAMAVSSRDLSDFSDFNGRTEIWAATFRGLSENPSILLTGTTPLIAGETMNVYFPANAPYGNFHNSFIAVLVSFGLPGLLFILGLVVFLVVRSVRLVIRGIFDTNYLHARLITAMLIFTLAESMMEELLLVDGMPSIVWVWFMLAAGFTFQFAREALNPPRR